MAKPVDMARTAAEKKAEADRFKEPMDAKDQRDYPWGLEIRLDHASLEKLGLAELPKPGSEMHVTGVVKVTSVRESADEKSTDRSVELQITHLALEAPDEARAKATKALYPTAGAKDDAAK